MAIDIDYESEGLKWQPIIEAGRRAAMSPEEYSAYLKNPTATQPQAPVSPPLPTTTVTPADVPRDPDRLQNTFYSPVQTEKQRAVGGLIGNADAFSKFTSPTKELNPVLEGSLGTTPFARMGNEFYIPNARAGEQNVIPAFVAPEGDARFFASRPSNASTMLAGAKNPNYQTPTPSNFATQLRNDAMLRAEGNAHLASNASPEERAAGLRRSLMEDYRLNAPSGRMTLGELASAKLGRRAAAMQLKALDASEIARANALKEFTKLKSEAANKKAEREKDIEVAKIGAAKGKEQKYEEGLAIRAATELRSLGRVSPQTASELEMWGAFKQSGVRPDAPLDPSQPPNPDALSRFAGKFTSTPAPIAPGTPIDLPNGQHTYNGMVITVKDKKVV